MNASILIPPALLVIGCALYVFWPQRRLIAAPKKTRADYLRERKGVLYDNLRDLNFEYRAGKYPAEDYTAQRESLEGEAAAVLAELEGLESSKS